jgi:Amt family ammonium transporter
VLGICSGAVAGLVAITPASGFVDPTGALIILFVIKAVIGLRVSEETERDGLDLALHGEVVQ